MHSDTRLNGGQINIFGLLNIYRYATVAFFIPNIDISYKSVTL